jgi:P-type Cu2+ transporter
MSMREQTHPPVTPEEGPVADHHGHHGPGGDGGHDGHGGHGDHAALFRDRFWWTLLLAVPVVVWSHHVQMLLGYTAPAVPGQDLIGPVLGSVVFFYGGWPFLTGGWQELRSRTPGMMLLITLAITVAYLASMATAVGVFGQEVWWELALLIAIMLLGHWIEMRAVGQAQGALSALADLMPDQAERVTDDGSTKTVATSDLAVGDVVLVRPGGRVPATTRSGRAPRTSTSRCSPASRGRSPAAPGTGSSPGR